MIFQRKLTTRSASLHDRSTVVALIRDEQRVHTHLDWQPPEDWLGRQPFRLAQNGRRVVAALACLTDSPDAAWLRVFAVVDGFPVRQAWEALWPEALAELRAGGTPLVAGLAQSHWLPPLLEAAGLQWTYDVITLRRLAEPLPPPPPVGVPLREARREDLDGLARLDALCFRPPWRLSRRALQQALAQATTHTVALSSQGELIGYQFGTVLHNTGHLARLAVHPRWQGSGLGTALTLNALECFAQMELASTSVNTQSNNIASTTVYQRLGFRPGEDRFPVYQLALEKK
ncbi:MAG: GNAT family N-acetyltransferase [Chloroflexi bacterium]|nr:GNAT family N-acetyltransferase [Chloroflexota bacterium]